MQAWTVLTLWAAPAADVYAPGGSEFVAARKLEHWRQCGEEDVRFTCMFGAKICAAGADTSRLPFLGVAEGPAPAKAATTIVGNEMR